MLIYLCCLATFLMKEEKVVLEEVEDQEVKVEEVVEEVEEVIFLINIKVFHVVVEVEEEMVLKVEEETMEWMDQMDRLAL